jgi:hypothetical protein
MVMRSVYLPEDMDLRLRQVAFALRRPKADLIRAFVSRGLRALPGDIDSSTSSKAVVLDQILAELGPISEQERLAFETDKKQLAEAVNAQPYAKQKDAAA